MISQMRTADPPAITQTQRNMKPPPRIARRLNSNAWFMTRTNPSQAAPQKLLPVRAILLFKKKCYLDIGLLVQELDAAFKAGQTVLDISEHAGHTRIAGFGIFHFLREVPHNDLNRPDYR
jgi:hypothetical protein